MKLHIAIYEISKDYYLIVTSDERIVSIVERQGAQELIGDGRRKNLYNDPDYYKLVYGNEELIKSIDPNL